MHGSSLAGTANSSSSPSSAGRTISSSSSFDVAGNRAVDDTLRQIEGIGELHDYLGRAAGAALGGNWGNE